jgi:hypothetical protein
MVRCKYKVLNGKLSKIWKPTKAGQAFTRKDVLVPLCRASDKLLPELEDLTESAGNRNGFAPFPDFIVDA